MPPPSLRTSMHTGLVVALAAILGFSLLTQRAARALMETNQRVAHTQQVLATLARTLALLDDAETGQRGYLLTGDVQYLEPYRQAVSVLPQHLQDVRHLTADNPSQQRSLDALESLVAERLAELHETIEILAQAGLQAARQVVSTGKGKQVMDQARTVIREMENGERALLTQRTVVTDRQARTTLALLFYADVLAGVLVAGAGYALNRALTKRQYAEQALQALNVGLEQQVAERTAGLQQAEAAERAQREYLQVTLASIGDAVIVTDAAGCVRFLNGVAQTLTGWPADAAAGQPLTTVFHIINEHTRQPVDNPADLVRRTGTVVGLANHTVLLRRDGSAVPIDDSAAPMRDEHGSLQGVVLVFRDVTVRRQAEQAFHDSQQQLGGILTSAMDAIITLDAEQRILFFNAAAEQMFRCPAAEVQGQPLDRFIPERFRQAHREHIRRFGQTQVTQRAMGALGTLTGRRADGEEFPIEASISQLAGGEQKLYTVILRDITERQQAQAALQQANADLEQRVAARTALLEMLQDITRAANEAPSSTEALQYAVDRLCTYTSWPVGHVYRAAGAARWAPTTVWHLDAPEPLAAFQQATQTVEFGAGEGLIGRVGTLGKPEWSVDVATDPAFQRRHAALEAGLKAGVAVPIVVGPEVVGVLEFYAFESLAPDPPLLDALTQIGIQLGRAVERERAAVRAQRQQEALVQREKLAAMGELLASVAHELNNPLAVILLQADLLRTEAGSGSLAESVEEIAQAATRCERLVRQFLILTRQHVPERTTVDLHALITSTMEFLAPPLQVDTIAVDLRFAAGLPLLGADPYQLQQVLVNLVTNAHQALRNAPLPRQVTLTTRCDPTRTWVTLEVADSGPGMPLEIQERIFEPFFTTKPLGVGTGLGLPLCQGIIASHGGTIRVTSQPGQGTTFQVELPVGVVPETAPPAQPGTMPRLPVPRLAILLVDDEPSLASTLARLLRRDGHTVDTAANGRLALARLAERAYDLVLCDVRMPELDGPSLYRLLERQQPHLRQRLIFLTGDTLEPATRAFLEASDAPCLTKPFSIAEARRVIQRTLQVAALSTPGTRPA